MKFKACLLLSLLCPALTANATSLFQAVEVSDAELANLRGRYVLPDRILSFGVTMSTVWHNSAGDAIGAQVNLQVNHQVQANITVTPYYQSGNGNPVNNGNGQIIGGAGLNNVQGIAQSVRSAGDFNSGLNDLSIDIHHGDNAPPPNGGQNWSGSQQFSNAAGTVSISSANGGLQMALQANHQQGLAQQQIGDGGVSQHANISGSFNNVQNLAALNVAMRDNPQGLQQAQCAWDQLRAMRPIGY